MHKIALFGAGRIGKIHAYNIAQNPRCQLAAIVDVYEPAARALAEKYASKVLSADEVFADGSIKGVFICSVTDTHADLIEASARASKTIFCEKPIDLSLERVNQCLNVVSEHNCKLFVGFNRRFDSNFRTLKTALDAGEIGKVELVTLTSCARMPTSITYIKVSGGLFKDMTVHDLDMACWLVGETPVKISASGSCLVDKAIGEVGDIDTAVVTLEFAKGQLAVITNSRRSSYGHDQRIEVHGEKGMLQAHNMVDNIVVKSTEDGIISQKPPSFFLERHANTYAAELDEFIKVLSGELEPEVTGEDGKQALMLAIAANKSLETGQVQHL